MKTDLLPRISRVEDLAAIRGPGPVLLAGPKDHVTLLLRHVLATGRVAAFLPPKYYRDGRVAVAVSLRPLDVSPGREAVRAHPVRRISRPAAAALVGGGLAVTAVLAWLVYAAVAWIAAHIAVILVVGGVLGAVMATAGRGTCKTIITIVHRH